MRHASARIIFPRVAAYALEDTSNTRLGRVYEQVAQRHPGESGFHILPTGPEALMMRIALIEAILGHWYCLLCAAHRWYSG